ncbi:MAG TPA: response regulator [Ignavibacteriaceae bacterium]|nr:response regulator [Ignavibacteriaceae bacterium]
MNNSGIPTILLVEDNRADIELLKESLSFLKLEVNLYVITNGWMVRDFLRGNGIYAGIKKPDLIILDINLPGKNGFEILEELRKDNPQQDLPVVILTSSRQEEDIILALKLHANAVMFKPSDFHEFISLIKSIADEFLKSAK